jgi:serine/threonine protein kinase
VPYNVAPEGLLHHEKTEEDYFAGGPDNDPPPDNDGDDDGETYGPEVDVWSAGCIFAELHLGHSLFNKFSYAHGARTLDQLLCIFRLFGTPSRTSWDDIEGREGWSGDSYPHWTPRSLLDVFPEDAIGPLSADLLWRLMTLDPSKRITARQALSHPYFTAPIEADARRFVREDWSQPDVVGAVERGTKRMIRKRQLAERDEEAREAGEAGDDTSGSKREVEVEAPSDVATETNMAIRKDLLSLGLPLGRSVIGRYVIAKLFEHPMVGNIVAYDKVNNQYTVQWHDCHASREILKEEDVVRFLLI